MKVVHWNMRFFPLVGGIESYVDSIVSRMPDIDFEIVTDAVSGAPRMERYRPNALVRRFPPVDALETSIHRKAAIPVSAILEVFREASERRYLKNAMYDVLHFHDFNKNLVLLEGTTGIRLFGDVASRLHDMRSLTHRRLMTKHFMWTEENSTPSLRRWEERLVNQFDTVICVDKAIYERFATASGTKRVQYIPNPIDTDMFSYKPLPLDEELIVGYAGRLDVSRGEQMLLEFARKLPKGIRLHMAVPHPGPRLEAIRRRLPQDRVELQTDVPYGLIPRFLSGIHVLLNPIKDFYSTTRITLEAMATGRPAIMFNTGSRYPIRHGENGYLVNPDLGSVINLIENLKSDREGLRRVSMASRDDIEREFAAPLVVSRIRHLYEELAA